MRKLKWPDFGDFLLSIIVDFIAGVILLVLQSFWPIVGIEIPVFVGLLFVNDLIILTAISLFREKEEPIIKLINDLDLCINDFDKFFRHPYWAIMPNPFENEPDFWKYYENTFSYVFHTWYSHFKASFSRSKKDMDIDTLVRYSIEFCDIVKYYLIYASTFRILTTKHSISRHTQEQYNTKFVGEFNTIFRPDLIKFLKNLQIQTSKEEVSIDVGSASPLEIK